MENGTILVSFFVWLFGSQHKEQEDGESRKAQSHFLDLVVAMQLNTPSSIICSVWIVMAFIYAEATRQQIDYYHLSTLFLNSVPANSSSTTIYIWTWPCKMSQRQTVKCVFTQEKKTMKKRKSQQKVCMKKNICKVLQKNSFVIYGNKLSWHLTSVIGMKITSEYKDKHKGHTQREKNVLFGCFCLCFKKNEIYGTATSLLPAWEL